MGQTPKVYLTFDVEDTINDPTFQTVELTLRTLKTTNLPALFFVTGQAAEKIAKQNPNLASMMNEHEVGYHSSSHSVRPTIFEYTDVPSYQQAFKIAFERETSQINPLNGQIEGQGGIHSLKELFPDKKIRSFRAPGFCWSPPHLEALKQLGITHDFSANLSKRKVNFKQVTFYPFSLMLVPPSGFKPWSIKAQGYIFRQIIANKLTVLTIHPQSLVNTEAWDSIYFRSNPASLAKVKRKKPQEIKKSITHMQRFFLELSYLQRLGIIEVTNTLESNDAKDFVADRDAFFRVYSSASRWAIKNFMYQPKFQRLFFSEFIEQKSGDN